MLMHLIRQALQDRKGVSSIEYGVLAALIIGVITVALSNFGAGLQTAFATLASSINTAF